MSQTYTREVFYQSSNEDLYIHSNPHFYEIPYSQEQNKLLLNDFLIQNASDYTSL